MQIFWLKILLPLFTAILLLNPHTPFWLALVALPLLLIFFTRRQWPLLLACLAAFLLLGVSRWLLLAPAPELRLPEDILFRGEVTAVSGSQHGQRLTLKDVELLTKTGKKGLPGNYQLFSRYRQQFTCGDQLRCRGRFRELAPPLNQGEPDWRWRGQRQGIVGEFHDIEILELTPGTPPRAMRVQHYLAARLAQHLQGTSLELACALLLGERTALATETRTQFVNAGVIHLLAVSGLHVGFIAAIMLGVLRLLPVSPKAGWLLLPLLLALYALLCGGRPSVVRAVLMAAFYFWGQVFERGVTPLQALMASATLVCLYNPIAFYEIGFQLSYLAVVAVLFALKVQLPAGWKFSKVWRALLVSLSCFVLLAPLLLYHFGALSPIGILVNLPAIPLVGVIIGQGALLIACAHIPLLGSAVGSALEFALQLLQRLVAFAATCPGANWQLPTPTLGQLLILLVLLGLLLGPGIRRRLQKITLLLLVAGVIAWYENSNPTLEIAAINVGQGDALLLRSPEGHTTLIDAGERRGSLDRGHLQVVPYLRRQGVSRLDLIILTHSDLDHMGGIPAVLREIGCDTLYLAEQREHPHFAEILDICDSSGTVIQETAAGKILVSAPGYRLYLLSPPTDWSGDVNDRSLVVKTVYGDCTALFTGDAGRWSEQMLIPVWGDFLGSDLLKAGHHGSNGSCSPEFIKYVAPVQVVISCGSKNRYGHPAPELLERLDSIGTAIHRTDQGGTFEIAADGNSWHLRPSWWQRRLGEQYTVFYRCSGE